MMNILLEKSWGFLYLILFLFLLGSCEGNTKEMLIGTWEGTDFDFEQSEGPDLSAMIDGGKELHINGQLILEEAGTYIITAAGGMINGKGTWEIKSGMLIMLDENGNEIMNTIEDLSGNELVTSNEVAMETPLGNIAGKITLKYSRR